MTQYSFTLNNGVSFPALGLGVYKTTDKKEMRIAVEAALEAGYRSFDTAQMYENEDLLGKALKASKFPRKELFLTSKVDVSNMGYARTLKSFQKSLDKLKTDYLDLFLIHWPGQQEDRCVETWRALEELYQQKMVRAIGVSNFLEKHIEWVLKAGAIVPAVNQIERHPLNRQKALHEWCEERGIQGEAWSPLLRGKMDFPEILALAKKYEKTPAQVILRWHIQSGFAVIPKSVRRERIFENADIFDFELNASDMASIDALDSGYHISRDPGTFDF